VSPQECTWHEEAICKGHWCVGPMACRPTKSHGQPANFYVGLDQNFVDTCLHEKGKAKATFPFSWPKLPSRPTPLYSLIWVSFVVTLSKMRWNGTWGLASVKATPHGQLATRLGRPTNTWQITELIKSVIAPGTSINTPCQWNSEHHTLFVVLHL
jgi:hypothetical protein